MISPILYVLLCVDFCFCFNVLNSDGRDGHADHDGHNVQCDGHDDRGDRGDRGGGLRPERILWLNNALVYALDMVCDVRFQLGLCGRQVL